MAPNPSPQTIVAELDDEFNRMAYSHEINQFAVEKIRRRAQALKNIDLPSYYRTLGRCACLLGEFDTLRSSYKSAITLDATSTTTWVDYGVSLSMWGFHTESLDALRVAKKFGEGDPEVFRRLFSQSWKACRFNEAASALENLEKMKIEINDIRIDTVKKSASLFQSHNISDDAGLEVCELVGKFLREKNCFNPGLNLSYISDEDSEDHITYTASLHENDETSADIFWELCAYLAEKNLDIEASGYLIFKVRKISENHKLVA